MEAKAFGLTDVVLLVVPHPIGAGLPEDKVKLKADNAIETLAKLMTGQC
jgi:hypothetical protein